MTDTRWRACLHEAGHLWAGFTLLGVVAPVVTVRPASGYLGACISTPPPPVIPDAGDRPRPWAIDPAIRRDAEAHITMLLAGSAAESLIWTHDRPDDDSPAACERRATVLAVSLERLAPRDLELLRQAESAPYLPDETASDLDAASEAASRLVGRIEGANGASAYLVMYLEQIAAVFVHRHSAAILEIADALRANTVMTGLDALTAVTPAAEVAPA